MRKKCAIIGNCDIESEEIVQLIRETVRELILKGYREFVFLDDTDLEIVAIASCLYEKFGGKKVKIVKTFLTEEESYDYLEWCMFCGYEINNYPDCYYGSGNRRFGTYLNMIDDADLILTYADMTRRRKNTTRAINYALKMHKSVINFFDAKEINLDNY